MKLDFTVTLIITSNTLCVLNIPPHFYKELTCETNLTVLTVTFYRELNIILK